MHHERLVRLLQLRTEVLRGDIVAALVFTWSKLVID